MVGVRVHRDRGDAFAVTSRVQVGGVYSLEMVGLRTDIALHCRRNQWKESSSEQMNQGLSLRYCLGEIYRDRSKRAIHNRRTP